jgi:hypothetical protein
VELSDKSKKLFADMIRKRLKARIPEHSDRIDMISDEELIERDRKHNLVKAEMFRDRIGARTPAKFEVL